MLGWHPPQLCSPRSGGKAVSKASVPSTQHLGAAVARLHGKIITPNLLINFIPWENTEYLPVGLGGDTAGWQV